MTIDQMIDYLKSASLVMGGDAEVRLSPDAMGDADPVGVVGFLRGPVGNLTFIEDDSTDHDDDHVLVICPDHA